MKTKTRIAIIIISYLVAPWFLILSIKNGANGPAASFSIPIHGISCTEQFTSFDLLFFNGYSGWFYSSWLLFFIIGIINILNRQKRAKKILFVGLVSLFVLLLARLTHCKVNSIWEILLFSIYQFFIGQGIVSAISNWKMHSTLIKVFLVILFSVFLYEFIGFLHVFLVHYPR